MVTRFTKLAIQKMILLVYTYGTPLFPRIKKAIATKDEKPALKIIVHIDTMVTLSIKSNCTILFTVIRQKVSAPQIVRKFIIEMGFNWKVFRIQVPKLLNITVERFAANPIISIYVYVKIGTDFSSDEGSFFAPKITPKRAPKVQLNPRRDPQQISWIQKTGNFLKSRDIFNELMS